MPLLYLGIRSTERKTMLFQSFGFLLSLEREARGEGSFDFVELRLLTVYCNNRE